MMDLSAGHDEQQQRTAASRARFGLIIDLVQAFGVIFAVVTALIAASTQRTLITTVLAIVATALVCTLAGQVTTHRSWDWRRRVLVFAQVAVPIAVVAGALVVAPNDDDQPPASPSTSSEPSPVVETRNYTLTISSFVDTNDQDKIDLDTGCPGWGSMRPRFGPSRCGELADLILDEEGLHSSDGRPTLVKLVSPSHAGYDDCQAALDDEPDHTVSRIDVDDIGGGSELCVRTDLNKVALVRIDDLALDALGQPQVLTISFTVWDP
jgi:hypothetical protein